MGTNGSGIFNAVFFFEDVKNSDACGTCERVATEGGAQLSVDGFEFRTDEQSTHRNAAGDTFGNGDEVWFDARTLVGEESSRASVSRLDFIKNHDCPRCGAFFTSHFIELVGRNLYASDTLDALHHESASVFFA